MPKHHSHAKNVVVNTSAGFALQIVGNLMAFVVRTIFIRTLGAQYTGMSTLFGNILNVLSLAELGIGSAITYALYKPMRGGDNQRIAALMHFYKKAYRVVAGIVLVAGLVCTPFLPFLMRTAPDIKENITLIFVLYLISNASSYLMAYKQTMLQAGERRFEISLISIGFALVRTTLEAVILIVFKSFIGYLVLDIIEALVRNFVISKRADHLYPAMNEYPDAKLTREETRRLFKDVGALSVYKICQVMLNSTDSLIIASVPALGVISVGILGNYRLIVNTVNTFVIQFYTSFTPSLGNMATRASAEKQYAVFKTTDFVSFWLVCFCSTSLLCLSTPFIHYFWGKTQTMPFSIVVILVFNFFISTTMRPTNAFRNSNGLFVQGWIRPLAMAILDIGLDIAFVNLYGIQGVLLSTALSRIVTQLWYDPWLIYREVFKRPVREYYVNFLIHLAITATACAISYALCDLMYVVSNHVLSFLCQMAVCAIVPNALVILFYHRTGEFKDFVARLKQLLRRGKRAAREEPKAEMERGETFEAAFEATEQSLEAGEQSLEGTKE